MADQVLYPIAGSPTRGLTILSGHWPVATAGAVGTKVCGEGMTLTRTGAGAYKITLAKRYKRLAAQHINVFTAAPATQGFTVNLASYTNTNDYITFTVLCGGDGTTTPVAATDPVDGEIHVTLVFQNAS